MRGILRVVGVVQGVGFRPFVYRLARDLGLAGFVRNTQGSVDIEVEGSTAAMADFLAALQLSAPPRSMIRRVDCRWSTPAGLREFRILESTSGSERCQPVPADIATCGDCLTELLDPGNRRFSYPFINCTNCGPRFTIISDLPYDRPLTTMEPFPLCPECQAEFQDPLNRRFHAQPNACGVCGPSLGFLDHRGGPVEGADPLETAVSRLMAGHILAIKGLGGFHLVCDATNPSAVETLRSRKRRPAKPLAVMMVDEGMVRRHCRVSREELELLSSPESPVVLLDWKTRPSDIVPAVAPGISCLGVMLPHTPLQHLLMRQADRPLVMTSGNLSEEPIARENDEAVERLGPLVEGFLVHNREILVRCDDSVVFWDRHMVPIRRARGFAPQPLILSYDSASVLALGAREKCTFTLSRGREAYVSPHIGDTDAPETLAHLSAMVEHYRRLFRIDPMVLATDLHPDFPTSRLGRELSCRLELPLVPVQHHHAHVVSCMVEHQREGAVIGVAFDGAGFGHDGTIWGGEFLVGDAGGMRRAAFLEPVALAGGDRAVRQPWRMAVSLVATLLGPNQLNRLSSSLTGVDPVERELVADLLNRPALCPLTSSAGRLFDGVAAMLGIRSTALFEGQAAMELESRAQRYARRTRGEEAPYPVVLDKCGESLICRLASLVEGILKDREERVAIGQIAWRFHRSLATLIGEVCGRLARDHQTDAVVLTGGCFQNRLLLRLVRQELAGAGLAVLEHNVVPCNDGGVSLGQAAIAHRYLRDGVSGSCHPGREHGAPGAELQGGC